MAFKIYNGADIAKTYFGSNTTLNQGSLVTAIDPSTLSSLQIWFDASQNTVTANGSDEILSISNEGALGGGFSFYPGTSTFDPAKKANFVGGTGDTMFYAFDDSSNTMRTVYKTISSITPKTVISIAKKVNTGTDTPFALWEVTKTSGTLNGVLHPSSRTSLTVGGKVGGATATPDTSLGSYSYGESDYTFFAWSADDYYANPEDMNMQTKVDNSVSATLVGSTGAGAYDTFVANVAEDLSPGAFSTGRNEYAGIMVFDEVLDEETISGIYKYYKNRGYSIK